MQKPFLLLISLFAFTYVNAQSVREIEDSALHYMQCVKKYSQYNHDVDIEGKIDSLYQYHYLLSEYLKNKLSAQPLTIRAEFLSAKKEGLHITNSEDKKVRIYCWSEEGGGTMMLYNSVIQYATSDRTKAEVMHLSAMDMADNRDSYGDFYVKIYTIYKKKQPIYLALSRGRAWSSYGSCSIEAFAIEDDTINHSVKVFKKGKDYFNSIDYAYELYHNYNAKTRSEIHTIHFNHAKDMLYIPTVKNDSITGRYFIYKWDGNYFVYDKNAK